MSSAIGEKKHAGFAEQAKHASEVLGGVIEHWLQFRNRQMVAVPVPGEPDQYYFVNLGGFVRPDKRVTVNDIANAAKWLEDPETTCAVIDSTLKAALKSDCGKEIAKHIDEKIFLGNDDRPYTEDEEGRCTSGHDGSTLIMQEGSGTSPGPSDGGEGGGGGGKGGGGSGCSSSEPVVLGITGTIGAGKGTVVSILERDYGFKHYSARKYLTAELQVLGKEPTRDNMVELANKLRADNHPAIIIERLLQEARKAGGCAVIESVRTPGEVEMLKKYGCNLLAIDASQSYRYNRVRDRGSSTDSVTLEQFQADEAREMTSTDPNKQNLSKCMELADVGYKNDGTVEQLEKHIQKYMADLNVFPTSTSSSSSSETQVDSSSNAKRSKPSAPVSMVFLESPYSKMKSSTESVDDAILRNIRYLQWCGVDSTARDEMPVASHMAMPMHPLCETHWVSDYIPQYDLLTRKGAIARAQVLRAACAKTVFYTDRGWSPGMLKAKQYCLDNGIEIEERVVCWTTITTSFPNINDFMDGERMLPAVINDKEDYRRYFPERQTLALIKPDAFKHHVDIRSLAKEAGLHIHVAQRTTLTRQQAGQLYKEHRGKSHFERLVKHMTSGPIWVLWFQSTDAVPVPCWKAWRALCGPTDPALAKAREPSSLRALYGSELPFNAVHGSDSVLSAHRELNLVLGFVRKNMQHDPNVAICL